MSKFTGISGHELTFPDDVPGYSDLDDFSIHNPSGKGRKEGDVMSDDLLPCPFCGGQVDPLGWLGRDSKGEITRGPECEGCGATACSAEDWNRREL
jgi:hypothetical protein